MNKNTCLIAALATGLLSAGARAQSFTIDWHTIDGGGLISAGGGFSLAGTIGQPDASAAPMTGGSFTLTGGFWAAGAAGGACPCEIDGDPAQVNVFDLLAFLDLWFANDPRADLDGTAAVDVFDLLAFLDCWFPAAAGAPCP